MHRLWSLCSLIAPLLTGACTAGASGDIADSAAGSPRSPSVAGDVGAGPITIVDQRGKTITLPHAARRVAFAVIPAPSIFAAVDRSYDRIVGINQSTLVANRDGMFASIFPASVATPTIASGGFVPNMETLLGLEPDVVVQWGHQGTDITAPIENAGIPVIGLKYGTEEDLERWITMFAQIAGKPERGEEMVTRMRRRIEEIRKIAGDISGTPQKVLTLARRGDGFATSNAKSYANFWITLAGGHQVSADFQAPDAVVSLEQILQWNPDVIILGEFDDLSPADLYGNPALATVDAIRNKRVYKNPLGGYRWEVPCAESPMMWWWMLEVLHPGKVPQRMRDIITEEFSYLYGYTVTAAQIDQILRFDVNSGSAHYDVFRR